VHQAGEKLGTVSFPNSGAADAQPDFLRGLALLHNFEYGDAARAFRSAEQRDPAFAIAYWPDAMTYSHMLWGEEDRAGARAVLARLGPTAAARLSKAKTPRERAYGAAVEAFLASADERTRARAFADSMRHVAEAYHKDLEAQAFTALAIMLAADHAASRDESNHLYLEAASYANHVFREQPQHPGAAHYLIHAYDDPARAANGLEAARAYARIAPSAEHAQHMPSHSFVQLGNWDDAARSNEQAWVSSRLQVKRKHAPPTALGFHTLKWLQYAYLQQGRYSAARRAHRHGACRARRCRFTNRRPAGRALRRLPVGVQVHARDGRLGRLEGGSYRYERAPSAAGQLGADADHGERPRARDGDHLCDAG
jgi:hypothetical protein